MENQKEKQIIEDAKKQADSMIREAEEAARTIYASSLEYVDDMLIEVELITLRAKENMRIQSQAMLEEFDTHVNLIEQHKQELLDMLHELSENRQGPLKKASYDIKIDEAYIPRKQVYAVKINDAGGERAEIHKPAKQSYEIKIADEWKGRAEEALAASEELFPEPDEEEAEGFKASDFDLDGEYFTWLEEKKKK